MLIGEADDGMIVECNGTMVSSRTCQSSPLFFFAVLRFVVGREEDIVVGETFVGGQTRALSVVRIRMTRSHKGGRRGGAWMAHG